MKGFLNHNDRDPQEVVNQLEQVIRGFTGSPLRQDDLICLALRVS